MTTSAEVIMGPHMMRSKVLAQPQETVGECVRRLQAEAKQLAKDHVRSLSAEIVKVEGMACEIAEGGEAYPPGIRDLCARLAEDLEARAQTLEAIIARMM